MRLRIPLFLFSQNCKNIQFLSSFKKLREMIFYINFIPFIMIDELHFPQTINDYVFIKSIANGGSAQCYLVESIKFDINKLFVAKVIPTSQFTLITAENKALMELNHPNIIKLYDRFTYSSYYVFILEYCENKSLAEAIIPDVGISGYKNIVGIKSEQTDLDIFKNCAYQIVSALSYCHMKRCAHRDIKPSNVLIDHYGKMKLADFGLSVKYQKENLDDEYEYEYEEEEKNEENDMNNENNEDKNSSTNKYQIPIMSPFQSENDKSQNNFETKIFYLNNNIQVKTRKLSSDTEKAKLSHNFFNIPKNEKFLKHKERHILRTRSFNDKLRISENRPKINIPNNIKKQISRKKIKKRKTFLCNTFCGSLVYASPEIILKKSYDPFSADIWSLGILFIVMFTGQSPWEGKGETQMQEKILNCELSPNVMQKIPSDLVELINKMIVVDPTKRSTIEEVRSSPFFDDPCIYSASPQKHPKIRTIQQKSHSYNSDVNFTHIGAKLLNKNRMNSPIQELKSPFANPVAQSPLAPSFKRLHIVKLPKTSMIKCSTSFSRKELQLKSPTNTSIPFFKKNSQIKLNLSMINSKQQALIPDSDESYSYEIQKVDGNETQLSIESRENNQQISQNNSSHISKSQSLHSPNVLHLELLAKL